ncbi:MAG: hypothetical protein HY329_18200 [Chloroflexi bacterium]|nr:hypothetical protein [Chloroflexota bacterium]
MFTRIEDALDDCLERLLVGKTLDECLDSYPELRDEIEPLLAVAAATRRALHQMPSEQFVASARYRIREAALRRRSRPWWGRWLKKTAYRAVVVSLSLTLVAGGTIAAADTSLPDEPLYSVKRAVETGRLALAASPDSLVDLHLRFAERRVAEARALDGSGRPLDPKLLQEATASIDQVLRLTEQMPPSTDVSARHVQLATEQRATIEEIASHATPTNQALLKPALDRAAQNEQRAREQLQRAEDPVPSESIGRPAPAATPLAGGAASPRQPTVTRAPGSTQIAGTPPANARQTDVTPTTTTGPAPVSAAQPAVDRPDGAVTATPGSIATAPIGGQGAAPAQLQSNGAVGPREPDHRSGQPSATATASDPDDRDKRDRDRDRNPDRDRDDRSPTPTPLRPIATPTDEDDRRNGPRATSTAVPPTPTHQAPAAQAQAGTPGQRDDDRDRDHRRATNTPVPPTAASIPTAPTPTADDRDRDRDRNQGRDRGGAQTSPSATPIPPAPAPLPAAPTPREEPGQGRDPDRDRDRDQRSPAPAPPTATPVRPSAPPVPPTATPVPPTPTPRDDRANGRDRDRSSPPTATPPPPPPPPTATPSQSGGGSGGNGGNNGGGNGRRNRP